MAVGNTIKSLARKVFTRKKRSPRGGSVEDNLEHVKEWWAKQGRRGEALGSAVTGVGPAGQGAFRRAAAGTRDALGAGGDYVTKGLYTASVAPFVAVGYPVMKLAGLGVKGGWGAAKGIGKRTGTSFQKSFGSDRARVATAVGALTFGTAGILHGTSGGIVRRTAERQEERRRDPGGAMDINSSLHSIHNRSFDRGIGH
jgi:hypothetical protein